MIEGIVGFLAAVSMIISARLQNLSHWLFSAVLILLPVIYMIFGALVGDASLIVKELVYGLPFIVAGFLCLLFGFKASGYLLASLWLIHGGYDIYHDILFINLGVPSWYPVLCAVVDVVVGCYLFYSVSKLPNFDIKSSVENS